MAEIGFFGENRDINSDLNDFFDMYKKAILVVFPNVKDIMFDKFADMVDYQVKNLKKRIFWHWMKDVGLEMLKESHARISQISEFALIDVF